jgi:hypothetical protein
LLIIFLNALPSKWLLRGTQSLAQYPYDISSADLRTKSSISAVCKSWNQVGTMLLYERVQLRRILHLPVFVRSLESPTGLGHLVKHLDIDCFVPRGYSQLLENETKRIFELCPNLAHFGFIPPFWIPILYCSLPYMSSSITSLEYSGTVPYSVILPSLIQLSQNLESLTLTLPVTYDDGHPLLAFDRLHDLHVKLEPDSTVSVSKWLIPNLRRLWVYGSSNPHTKILVQAYGRGITFLGMHPNYPLFHLRDFLDPCPVLEHLAVQVDPSTQRKDRPESVIHSRLKFLDLFTSGVRRRTPPFSDNLPFCATVESLKDVFPTLQECRNFDFGMPRFGDLPPPMPRSRREFRAKRDTADKRVGDEDDASSSSSESEGGSDNMEIVSPEDEDTSLMKEDEGASEVLADILEFSHPNSINGGADFFRNNMSDDYVPNADDDDDGSCASDSDSGSCITVNDDGWERDRFYSGEDWEVDHDEALAMFDRTRAN